MRIICIFCSLLISFNLFAQEWKYGAKAGVNVSNIIGEMETDDTGKQLESTVFIAGFHIGPTLNYKTSDKSSFSMELLFSQKGVKNRFEDESSFYYLLKPKNDTVFTRSKFVEGEMKQIITTNLGYLDLSAMYYYNIVSNFKVGIGATVGVLLNGSAIGTTEFSGRLKEGSEFVGLDKITISNDYQYIRNKALYDDPDSIHVNSIVTDEVLIDGNSLLDKLFVPEEVGAYYDFPEKQGHFFNRLDLGVNLELRWELDSGLYFGLRGSYGLLDATNNYYDFSRDKVDENLERISRSDFDRNVSIQTSVGFNF